MERGRELMGKSRSKSPKLSMIFSHSVGMINCDNVPVKDKTITGVVSASSNNPDLAEPLIESEDHHTDNPTLVCSGRECRQKEILFNIQNQNKVIMSHDTTRVLLIISARVNKIEILQN